jgi:hypothetical protein
VPEIAIESCEAPAVAVVGMILVMVGTALSDCAGGAGDDGEDGDDGDELVPPHPFTSRATRPRQAIANCRKVIRKVTI